MAENKASGWAAQPVEDRMNKTAQLIEDMAAKGMARKEIANRLCVSHHDLEATMRVLRIKPNRPTLEQIKAKAAAERRVARLAALDARHAAARAKPLVCAHNPWGTA